MFSPPQGFFPPDITERTIANMRIATEFDTALHAGTYQDPWSQTSLTGALANLPSNRTSPDGTNLGNGGTVYCSSDVFKVTSTVTVGEYGHLDGSGHSTWLMLTADLGTSTDMIVVGSGNGHSLISDMRVGSDPSVRHTCQ